MNDNDYDTNNPVDGLSDAGTATRSCRRSIAIGRSGARTGAAVIVTPTPAFTTGISDDERQRRIDAAITAAQQGGSYTRAAPR